MTRSVRFVDTLSNSHFAKCIVSLLSLILIHLRSRHLKARLQDVSMSVSPLCRIIEVEASVTAILIARSATGSAISHSVFVKSGSMAMDRSIT